MQCGVGCRKAFIEEGLVRFLVKIVNMWIMKDPCNSTAANFSTSDPRALEGFGKGCLHRNLSLIYSLCKGNENSCLCFLLRITFLTFISLVNSHSGFWRICGHMPDSITYSLYPFQDERVVVS